MTRRPRLTPSAAAALSLIAGLLLPLVALRGNSSAQAPQTTTTVQTTPPAPTPRQVRITARLHIKFRSGAFRGSGSVRGKPFGNGRFTSRCVVKSNSPLRIGCTLTAIYKAGRVVFKGTGRYEGSTLKATMRVVSGTGAYRDIDGEGLKVTDVNRRGVDTMKVRGKVTYTPAPAGTSVR